VIDTEQNILIDADGTIRFIWDDALAELCEQGEATVRRVASVEPTDAGAGWIVDLTPIGGRTYGPYPLRDTALLHERAVVEGRLIVGQLEKEIE
jgi:hypothetical protein